MRAHGELAKAGVEGTGSYGAGLACCLAGCGIEVARVIRPNRQARRRRGKSDAADAVAAALAALSGEASGMPKSRDGPPRPVRMLRVARAGTVKGSYPGGQPAARADPYRPRAAAPAAGGLSSGRQVELAARFQPGSLACLAEGAKAAMATLAHRHQSLTIEIAQLDAVLEELVTRAAPAGFLAKQGVATQVAATLLVTAGDNPGWVRKEASFAGQSRQPRRQHHKSNKIFQLGS